MKTNKFIIVISLLTIMSCVDDDFSREYVDDEVKTDLIGTVSFIDSYLSNGNSVAYDGRSVEFAYTLPQSFDVESTLEVTIQSTVGVLEVNPNIEKLNIIVPAGTTSGTESFVMPNYGNVAPFSGIPEFLTISLTGILLTQPEEGSVDDPFTLSSEPVPVELLQTNLISSRYQDAVYNVLMMSLDWEGPYVGLNDLDLYVFNTDFSIRYENSWTTDRFEGDFFNNPANEDFPDGDYIILVDAWTTASADPVPYKLLLTHPDASVDVFTGSIDPAIGFKEFLMTQTTNGDGDRSYVITPL